MLAQDTHAPKTVHGAQWGKKASSINLEELGSMCFFLFWNLRNNKTQGQTYIASKTATCENWHMDRWKAEMGRVRKEKRRRKKIKKRRERVRRKKMQMREKVGKSQNTVFFQWFVAPEGRKVGSLKRRVRSQLARWEMKKRTPLWREAHFQVKMYNTHHSQTTFGSCDVEKVHAVVARSTFVKKTHDRTTFGSWDVEKVHAVVARSTFACEKVKNTTRSDHFWKLRWRKVHTVVARSTFRSQNVKNTTVLDVQMSFRVAGARDCGPCQKWAKREGFVAFPKTMAGVGHLNRICKDAFSVAGAVQETSSSELLGGPGADFLRGVPFWSLRSSVLLRWFCVTGAALHMTWHHFFVAGAVL